MVVVVMMVVVTVYYVHSLAVHLQGDDPLVTSWCSCSTLIITLYLTARLMLVTVRITDHEGGSLPVLG